MMRLVLAVLLTASTVHAACDSALLAEPTTRGGLQRPQLTQCGWGDELQGNIDRDADFGGWLDHPGTWVAAQTYNPGAFWDRGNLVYDVRAFGASGLGVLDDAPEIQAAIDAAAAVGGTVYLPPGNYLLGSTLNIGTSGAVAGLTIRGAATSYSPPTTGTFFTYAGATTAFQLGGSGQDVRFVGFRDLSVLLTGTGDAFRFADPTRFFDFKNVTVYGSGTGTGTAFKMVGQVSCNCFHRFEHVVVRNLAVGFTLSGFANANHFEDTWCGVVGTCFDVAPDGADTMGGNDNTLERCEINGSVTLGINLESADRNTFISIVEDGNGNSLAIDANSDHNKFSGCTLPDHAVPNSVLQNQTFEATRYSSTPDQAIGAHAGYHRFIPTDGPETCNANLSGARYDDPSLKKLCRCDGSRWCREDTGECGTSTSCGTTDLRPVVNVQTYLAAGDGVADDTAEIRAAEAACPSTGCTLLFPGPATYLVSDELTYRSHQRWVATGGAIIKLANSSVANLIRSVSSSTITGIIQPAASAQTNVRFRGLILDGNKANNSTTNSGDGLNILDQIDVEVDGVTVRQVPRDGITVGESAAGVTANIRIKGYVADDVGLSGVNGGSGLAITSGDDIQIDGPHIESSQRDGIDIEPNASRLVRRVSIRGGELLSNALNGFLIDANTGGAGSVIDVTVSGVKSALNTARGFRIAGPTVVLGMLFEGNTAYRNSEEGFRLDDQEGVRIIGNFAIENGQASANTYSGFYLDRANLLVIGNYAYDNQGTKTQKYGIEEDAGASSNDVCHNAVTAHGTSRYRLGGDDYGNDSVCQLDGLMQVPSVDVRSFGAKCDGTTDDTAAIQQAEDAADNAGGTVKIPSAVCVTATGLVLSSNVSLVGDGPTSVLKAGAALGNVPVVQSEANPASNGARDTRISIRDLTIDGSANATGTTSGPCITLRSVVDATVENVRCLSPKGDCVTIANSSTAGVLAERNTVKGLTCVSAARSGIAITSGAEITLADFHIKSPALHGVNMELSSTANLAIDGVTIGPGTIDDADTTTATCGIAISSDAATHTIANVTVANVVIDDPGDGICFRGVNNFGVSAVTIRSPSDDGIVTLTAGSEPVSENVSIGGAVVIEDPAGHGLNWTAAAPLQVGPLTVKNSGNHGIRVTAATGGTITGANVDTTAATKHCIAIADATDVSVAGGVLKNCAVDGVSIGGATATTGTVVAGVRVDATSTCIDEEAGVGVNNSTIVGNDVRGCTAAITTTGNATLVSDNTGFTRTSAQLGSLTAGNASTVYCTDCDSTSSTCAAGTGALAKRVNGAWRCD